MSETCMGRRQALATLVAAASAALLAPALANAADELPHLEESDPTANALGYKHDTTQVDAAARPTHKPDQKCSNCNLVQGADGDAWRPCGLFPGKAVNANGWCAAWVLKQ